MNCTCMIRRPLEQWLRGNQIYRGIRQYIHECVLVVTCHHNQSYRISPVLFRPYHVIQSPKLTDLNGYTHACAVIPRIEITNNRMWSLCMKQRCIDKESIMIQTILKRCQGDFSAALVESKNMARSFWAWDFSFNKRKTEPVTSFKTQRARSVKGWGLENRVCLRVMDQYNGTFKMKALSTGPLKRLWRRNLKWAFSRLRTPRPCPSCWSQGHSTRRRRKTHRTHLFSRCWCPQLFVAAGPL